MPAEKNQRLKIYILLVVLRRLRHLMENIFGKKRDMGNRGAALKTTKGPLQIPKFHELWSTNAINRTFIFTQPLCTLYPDSLPTFAKGGHGAERTQPNFATRWEVSQFANARQKFEGFTRLKSGVAKIAYFRTTLKCGCLRHYWLATCLFLSA